MKRLIATMLILALFTGMSAGKASAQDGIAIAAHTHSVISISSEPDYGDGLPPLWFTAESGLTDISGMVLRFAATEIGIIDPDDCPRLGGQEGEDIVDLWFELVDAGYTEDEAFDLVEMVMGEDNALGLVGGTMCSAPGEESIRTEQPEYLYGNQRSHLTPEQAFPY